MQLGVMNLAGIRIGPLRSFIHYLQDGLPLKLKAIYAINVSSLANLVKSLIKPFMNPEVYNGVRTYNNNNEKHLLNFNFLLKVHFLQANAINQTLTQEIGTECLPADLGGPLPCLDTLHETTVKKLYAMKPFFEAELQQRCKKQQQK